jgi:hypothetical protein
MENMRGMATGKKIDRILVGPRLPQNNSQAQVMEVMKKEIALAHYKHQTNSFEAKKDLRPRKGSK